MLHLLAMGGHRQLKRRAVRCDMLQGYMLPQLLLRETFGVALRTSFPFVTEHRDPARYFVAQ